MRAKTHPGAEKHIETSSSDETMDTERLEQKGREAIGEANEKLEPTGLTARDIAEQSAYEDDEANVAEQAANSDNR